RALRVATLVFAFIAPPMLAGFVTLYSRTRGADALDPVATGGVPMPPRPPAADATGRRLAVIVAGNRGTEITDSLALVELLEESGAFQVRIVAPRRVVSPFRSNAIGGAGVDFVPDLSFADYDALVGRPPDLLIVPYLSAWQHEDAAVVPWIRAHVGPETMLLSICQGAEVAAATGLFDGYAATGHYRGLDRLAAEHPQINYKRDVRWVRDRNRMSSGSLTAGLDATLAAIDRIAGRAAALRAATAAAYRHTHFLDDPTSVGSRDRTGLILEMAYRWKRTKVAVVIGEGASESAIAALLDMYAATLTTDSVAVAMSPDVLSTRHGVRLLPHDTTAHLGDYRYIAFAAAVPVGVASYDAALAEIAHTHGKPMSRAAARLMNYPAQGLGLEGGIPVGVAMVFRIVFLGLLGVLARFAIIRWSSRRRVAPGVIADCLDRSPIQRRVRDFATSRGSSSSRAA
ncbi:MAG TPA: DJ-1/PfpI family protein, partial [Kofleriaceae bacterium]|nr:DJ-1/PfpI family protein [Kofleriaceae bacterium]